MRHHAPRRAHAPRARNFVLTLLCLPFAGCAPADPEPTAEQAPPEPPQVTILGHDYAFELAEPVPSGTVHFAFENVGEVPHEAVLVELNDGVTAERVAGAIQGGEDPRSLMSGIAGILIADPGETAMGRLVVDLEPGRTYALLCNFTDADDDPPHLALGMMRFFEAT